MTIAAAAGAAGAIEMNGRSGVPSLAEQVAGVRQIYRDLEARPIERDCRLRTQCCHFRLTGKIPYLTRGEALVAARAWRASGRRTLPEKSDGSCPLLDPGSGRCRIYDDRPFGCRTHFCSAAGGPYPRDAVVDLIRRLEAIDRDWGGRGAQSLPVALRDALEILGKAKPRRKSKSGRTTRTGDQTDRLAAP